MSQTPHSSTILKEVAEMEGEREEPTLDLPENRFPVEETTRFTRDMLDNSYLIRPDDRPYPETGPYEATAKKMFVEKRSIGILVAAENLAKDGEVKVWAGIYAIKAYGSNHLHFLSTHQEEQKDIDYIRALTLEEVLGEEGKIQMERRYMNSSNEDHFVAGHPDLFYRAVMSFIAAYLGTTRFKLLREEEATRAEIEQELAAHAT